MAGKIENKKFGKYKNENRIACFGDQTRSTFPTIPSVSRTDNFVIVNVFKSVTSSRVTGNLNFARKEGF